MLYSFKHTRYNILQIGCAVNTASRYGVRDVVDKLAARYKISRSTCYNYARIAEQLLNDKVCYPKPMTRSYSPRADKDTLVLRSFMELGLSVANTCSYVRRHGIGISKGEVTAILKKVGGLLSSLDKLCDLPSSDLCLMIDEVFAGGNTFLVVSDARTGYILALRLVTDRSAKTWCALLEELCGESELPLEWSVSADFATSIKKALADMNWIFHGDVFHFLKLLDNPIGKAWKSFEKTYNAWEKATTQLLHIEKDYVALLVPGTKDDNKLRKAEQNVENCYQIATEAMLHHEKVVNLFRQAQAVFHYFDEHGNWIDQQKAEQTLQTIAQEFVAIGNADLQKKAQSFQRHIQETTRYIGQLQPAIQQLTQQDPDPHQGWIWQCIAFLYQCQYRARQQKNHSSTKYFQQQATEWTQLIEQQIGSTETQRRLQQLSDIIATANRSSSCLETNNSRIKPFLRTLKGQVSQQRLNLIRFQLNHKIYKRSRIKGRKGFSPYQLLFQRLDDKREWTQILKEKYLSKAA